MPPGCFAPKGETTIAKGNLYTLSVSFADSSPIGGAFPETCRFPAGGIVCRPYSGIVRPFWLFVKTDRRGGSRPSPTVQRCNLCFFIGFGKLDIAVLFFKASAQVFVSAVHGAGTAGALHIIMAGFGFDFIPAEFAADGIAKNHFLSS